MINSGALWVVCEAAEGSHLELIGKARGLLEARDMQVVALLAGEAIDATACFAAGADVALALTGLTDDPCHTAENIARALNKHAPQIVLFPATVRGRMLSAWVAARLNTGLTADCTALTLDGQGLLLQTRPAFGGSLTAQIVCRERRPQMASVRPKVFLAPVPDARREGITVYEACEGASRLHGNGITSATRNPLEGAEIVVAGGKGIGSRAGFAMLERLAKLLGGAVGATRSAVDAGYADYARQIGQTGLTVRPRVYIAVAVSGLVQHIVGMSGAETVVAVNRDRRAPIFHHADYGIVADWEDAVGEMIKNLSKETWA